MHALVVPVAAGLAALVAGAADAGGVPTRYVCDGRSEPPAPTQILDRLPLVLDRDQHKVLRLDRMPNIQTVSFDDRRVVARAAEVGSTYRIDWTLTFTWADRSFSLLEVTIVSGRLDRTDSARFVGRCEPVPAAGS